MYVLHFPQKEEEILPKQKMVMLNVGFLRSVWFEFLNFIVFSAVRPRMFKFQGQETMSEKGC